MTDRRQWRPMLVPAWLPEGWLWRIIVAGLVVMVTLCLSTILVWVLIDDQQSDFDRGQSEQLAATQRVLDRERERMNARQCEAQRRAVQQQRDSDIITLAYTSNLDLDLTGIPLDDNTRFALAVLWAQAITAQAEFIQARVNTTPLLRCDHGVPVPIPTPQVGLNGAPEVLSATLPAPDARGGTTARSDRPGAAVPGSTATPAPTSAPRPPATTPTTTCPKVNRKGTCVGSDR